MKKISNCFCYDCGRPYGSEYGFPDLIIEDWAWKEISPKGNSGGLLCPSCICKHLSDKNIYCYGEFTSGPLVDRCKEEIYDLAWNLGYNVAKSEEKHK